MRVLNYLSAFAVFVTLPEFSKESSITLNKPPLSPVILIPGFGGSRIDARLNKSHSPHFFCKKNSDWFSLWLNMKLLLPLAIDCWIDNIKLVYDAETRTTRNNDGVETRIPGFGDPESVEILDVSLKMETFSKYFKDIGDALVNIGYARNVSLRGAPYDFRRAPNENQEWFSDLKVLIEDTFNLNQQTPVTLVCHSMGCPMSLLFLQAQSNAWKDLYIRRYITLSAPWGGLVKAMKIFAIGDDIVPMLPAIKLRQAEFTFPAIAWLLPSPNYWSEDEVLVQSMGREYTVNDYEKFFKDLNYSTGWEMRKDTAKLLPNGPPEVETHCLYGRDTPTPEQLVYTWSDLVTFKPKLIPGDGDGSVNLRSLRGCRKWALLQEKPVEVKEFDKADHYMDMLRRKDVVQHILDIVSEQ